MHINYTFEVSELKRGKLISGLTFIVGIVMISIGMMIQNNMEDTSLKSQVVQGFNVKNMAASANKIIEEEKEETKIEDYTVKEIEMETAPASVIVPPRVEVYEGMTLEELGQKLDRSLKNDIAGKGIVIAQKCIELGVDPYIATAIILHETGCGQSSCSQIARTCYNFGGQKGYGCGAYKRYNSIDEGLQGMIQNLYNNYYSHGLTTIESIGPRYAESGTWISKINWYVGQIRAN